MPMEQVFRHCDKDTLKLAMLKHEETFRQQVHELHRLYRIQKLLMRDLKRELKSQSNLSTSPNGGYTEHGRGALGMCAYEHRYAARGPGGYVAVATPTPRTALSLDVVAPAVEYVRSAEEDEDDEAEEETDDDAELELTLAVGGGGAKKRYGEYPSGGESLSSSSTESDVLTAAASGREWRQARGTPYHKRRPAAGGLDVVQVEDGVGMQAPPPLLFHWLSLKMA
ncbi:hypothetical protein SEVIR_9G080000v4 [Setaria viridis]|uniref:Uncharacterized protein n=1 Tax=Setaria viridis TaxID=4556 RepID=A0A4U6SSS8_SETVI|nr:uncharacterized protein LOC117836090 [Setaria viridis]TKV91214.1 hypothetical protein SEVIR_9G080000v2 [Setaria viridis]